MARKQPFDTLKIQHGLAYALNEYGEELNPVLLYVLASMIYNLWSPRRHERTFDDVKSQVLDRAFEIAFRLSNDHDKVQKLRDAYSGAVGKLHNSLKPEVIKSPNFSPDARVSAQRKSKTRVTTELSGQKIVRFKK